MMVRTAIDPLVAADPDRSNRQLQRHSSRQTRCGIGRVEDRLVEIAARGKLMVADGSYVVRGADVQRFGLQRGVAAVAHRQGELPPSGAVLHRIDAERDDRIAGRGGHAVAQPCDERGCARCDEAKNGRNLEDHSVLPSAWQLSRLPGSFQLFPSDGRWPRFLLPRGEAAIRDCRVGLPSSLVSAVNWGRRRQSRRPLFLFQMESSLRHAGKGTAQAGAADRLHGAQITLSGNDNCFASAERFRHGNSSEVFPCAR